MHEVEGRVDEAADSAGDLGWQVLLGLDLGQLYLGKLGLGYLVLRSLRIPKQMQTCQERQLLGCTNVPSNQSNDKLYKCSVHKIPGLGPPP